MGKYFIIPLSMALLLLGCSNKPTEEKEDTLSSSLEGISSGLNSSGLLSSDNVLSSSSQEVLLSSSAVVLSAADSILLIDDFEDGNADNSKQSYWYSFNDNDGGGLSTITPATWEETITMLGGYNSAGMLSVNVSLVKGTYKYAPYYAFGTMVPKTPTANPADFDGITYWHKGVAHTLRVDVPDVTDYDNHLIEIPAHADWTLVTIDFAMLAQEGWGKKVALDVNQDIKVVWVLRKTSGAFAIDDIKYIKDIVYPIENNMQILPPSIPAAVVPKGDVNTTLNTLSKKYLTKGVNFTNWGEQGRIDSTLDPKNWQFNEASVKKQADQGMLGLRFPIDLDLYILNRDSVLKGTVTTVEVEPFLYSVLDSFNVWTKRHGLSYTIDFHAYDGTYSAKTSKDSVYARVMSTLWKRVAEHFVAETREDLFFELTNEPMLSLPSGEKILQADWTALAKRMIDSIRTVSPTRPVIFGDTEWYSLDKLILNTPFADQYVIYAFHMYDPFIFTHQGAAWSEMGTTKNVPFPYSEAAWSTEFRDFGVIPSTPAWVKTAFKNYYKEGNKTFIKNRLIKAKDWAFTHQVPLICNEWGAYNKNAKLSDLNVYFQTMGEIFQELDISWQVWFGIMDDNYDLLPGMAEALDLN